jgi:uncharacterized protein YjiS (DUF1127 family)
MMTKHTIHPPAEADELTLSWLSEMELIRKAHRARSEAIADWLGKAGKTIGRWFRAYFQRGRERQRIMNELYSLDDRSLSDLGITRGDIPFVANGHSRVQNPRNDNDAKAA